MDKDITGLMVYYYEVCKRKLWYFINEIQLEKNNSNVILGKLLEENTYTRDEKKINIDGVINIDFIRSKKVLHEIKKSNSIEPASLLQDKSKIIVEIISGILFVLFREKRINWIKRNFGLSIIKANSWS